VSNPSLAAREAGQSAPSARSPSAPERGVPRWRCRPLWAPEPRYTPLTSSGTVDRDLKCRAYREHSRVGKPPQPADQHPDRNTFDRIKVHS
jgi:hypothetical protein